jgi:hypothetical protein
MAEQVDISGLTFDGHALTPDQAQDLTKVIEDLEHDAGYQHAIGLMTAEAKKDAAQLSDPTQRAQAEAKILATDRNELLGRILTVEGRDIRDHDPQHVDAYHNFAMTMAAIDVGRNMHMSDTTTPDTHSTDPAHPAPPDTAHPDAHTDHPPVTAGPPSPDDAAAKAAEDEEKAKQSRYGLIVDKFMPGVSPEMKATMIALVGMIDGMMGGMIDKQVEGIQHEAVAQVEQTLTNPQNQIDIGMQVAGPLGGLAVAGTQKLVEGVETLAAEIPVPLAHDKDGHAETVASMFGNFKDSIVAGLNDPAKVHAALASIKADMAQHAQVAVQPAGPPAAPVASPKVVLAQGQTGPAVQH